MIFLRISSRNEQKIELIAEILLKEKLAIDLNLKRNVERLESINGKVKSTKIWMLTAKTKALLFLTIEKRFREEFKNDTMPELYSTPIVNMDWKQAEHLSASLKQV